MLQESRDRRVVLAALRAADPSALTLLPLYYLTALPEDRVQTALAHLEATGLVLGWEQPGRGLPGPRHTHYRALPARIPGPTRGRRQPSPIAILDGGSQPRPD
jgi:hypothetical protein